MACLTKLWSVFCISNRESDASFVTKLTIAWSVPTPAKSFKIITGVGKHSANHVAILRPGVAKALEQDGWVVDRSQKDRGYILVRGSRY